MHLWQVLVLADDGPVPVAWAADLAVPLSAFLAEVEAAAVRYLGISVRVSAVRHADGRPWAPDHIHTADALVAEVAGSYTFPPYPSHSSHSSRRVGRV
jgi:hypothetical protein